MKNGSILQSYTGGTGNPHITVLTNYDPDHSSIGNTYKKPVEYNYKKGDTISVHYAPGHQTYNLMWCTVHIVITMD